MTATHWILIAGLPFVVIGSLGLQWWWAAVERQWERGRK